MADNGTSRGSMRTFVAGATGVIGRVLVPLLIDAGHTVVGTTRKAEGATLLKQMGAQPVVLDAFDRRAVMDAVASARPDVVMHQLTALSESDFALNSRIRVEGTHNLVDAAVKVGVRKIIAQSVAFVYADGETPATEEEPFDLAAPMPRRQTVTGVWVLEIAAFELPEAVVLRYGTLYGPGTWFERHGKTAEQVRRGEIVADTSITSFLHVQDAAHAALLALDWPSDIVNIVDDEPAPGTEWLPHYAQLLGAPPPPVGQGRQRGARGASNTKARHMLGWQPLVPSWRHGFEISLKASDGHI